jgi:hypothetical protein
MIKRFLMFVAALLVVVSFASTAVHAQCDAYNELKKEMQKKHKAKEHDEKTDVRSLNELHNWFTQEYMKLSARYYNKEKAAV